MYVKTCKNNYASHVQLYLKKTLSQVFPVNFPKFLRTFFLQHPVAASFSLNLEGALQTNGVTESDVKDVIKEQFENAAKHEDDEKHK